ncbi:DUF6344 domain-containing protein [Streptomyces sp. NBC_00237]|uniref:DUF6344 domain-containing protein n=1 Tax=Streptomyces sp. NBC_00237 TaxID=2975687 RepID=UPI0022523FBD|nr:DUF6344 domain-containing protein [Streptomyces sp. NBC_00237]MCX5200174.1 DUF6344 domain-containing protein [Streptomyces sp. NBC_00237]
MKTMWTALISAIVALLAMLGFAAPASAAAAAAPTDRSSDAPQPVAPAAVERTAVPAGRLAEAPAATWWRADTLTRSVPPTMKQRIGAEAHGGSPSARKVPALDALDGLGGLTAKSLADEAAAQAATRGEGAKTHVAA